VHVKQRHTAVRILERLRDEHGFTGGYTIVRNYVYKAAVRQKEMFMPLAHLPGHAQADFGEADGYIDGKLVRFHYFCLDMPHSDGCFVKAYPTENTESFLDGHVAAFAFLGSVPQSILHDNAKIAVAKNYVMGNVSVPRRSVNYKIITRLKINLGGLAVAMTRGMLRVWSVIVADTSWCRYPLLPILML